MKFYMQIRHYSVLLWKGFFWDVIFGMHELPGGVWDRNSTDYNYPFSSVKCYTAHGTALEQHLSFVQGQGKMCLITESVLSSTAGND